MQLALADIEIVKGLVVEAGKKALGRWGGVAYEFKADESLVTAVDKETEQFLSGELERHYPQHAFIGEEFDMRGSPGSPTWACDPIDGTTNFVYGLPHWGVSLGLLDDGLPMMGAIYLPVFEELYWAELGKGAYCNGKSIPPAGDRETLHPEDTICMSSNALKTLNTSSVVGRLRCLGSIAAELAYTANGSLCGTVGLYEGIVDMAAGLCIGNEVGCVFRHLAGPSVDVKQLTQKRRTDEHFIFAPPRLTELLQQTLRTR